MPKFEWGVTLVMERQKCVPLIVEAQTLEDAKKKISHLFLSQSFDALWTSQLNKNEFLKMFPGISLEHDGIDESFEDSWNECKVYGWDHVSPAKESAPK